MKAGRRDDDGTVRLSALVPGLISLTVSHKAERATSVLLTREQTGQLRQALAELDLLLEPEDKAGERWDGADRRQSGMAA